MAKKKPAKRAATTKTVKKTVSRARGARTKASPQKATRKKPPAMKAAVRVTKKNSKAVKPTAKSASKQAALPFDSPQSEIVAAPAPMPPDGQCLAKVPEPAAAAARHPPAAKSISRDEIQHRAYLKWEAAGRPDGDGGHFWAEAERELLQQM